MNDDRPFTPDTLADRWDVSAETVRQLCHRGELRSFRVNRMFRIPHAAVEEFEAREASCLVGSRPLGGRSA